ncbi:hypothetical protein ACHQM5_003521 [Ranunculus cassubicifolius]
MSISLSFSYPILLLLTSSFLAQAIVPKAKTFRYVNKGFYGEYEDEYGSNYRLLFELQEPNFAMCFYNTTPGAYTLGIRMGSRPEDSTSNIMKWVWAANRNNLVGENATLTFGADGNLVLAHANGKVAWQTNTANKGVVGLELLSTGNLVLVDKSGKFVWQSFDYPTDSLLVGQGLRNGGITKLVSRVSNKDGSEGAYSLVLEKDRLALYEKKSSKLVLLHSYGNVQGSTVNSVVLRSAPASDLSLNFILSKSTSAVTLVKPNYNSTLSFLRVESDRNVRVYTYAEWKKYGAWNTTYHLY